jgi:hypothetical protein
MSNVVSAIDGTLHEIQIPSNAQVHLRLKVIVLLIFMEFMIITVYKLSFHINQ